MHDSRLELLDDESRQITASSFASTQSKKEILRRQLMNDRRVAFGADPGSDVTRKIPREIVEGRDHKLRRLDFFCELQYESVAIISARNCHVNHMDLHRVRNDCVVIPCIPLNESGGIADSESRY